MSMPMKLAFVTLLATIVTMSLVRGQINYGSYESEITNPRYDDGYDSGISQYPSGYNADKSAELEAANEKQRKDKDDDKFKGFAAFKSKDSDKDDKEKEIIKQDEYEQSVSTTEKPGVLANFRNSMSNTWNSLTSLGSSSRSAKQKRDTDQASKSNGELPRFRLTRQIFQTNNKPTNVEPSLSGIAPSNQADQAAPVPALVNAIGTGIGTIGPQNPIDKIKPVSPVNPTVNPTNASSPGAKNPVIDTLGPIATMNPVNPTNAIDPIQSPLDKLSSQNPINSINPKSPPNTVKPPSSSLNPVKPQIPVDSVTPALPVAPATLSKPEIPVNPTAPVKPETLVKPVVPTNPLNPVVNKPTVILTTVAPIIPPTTERPSVNVTPLSSTTKPSKGPKKQPNRLPWHKFKPHHDYDDDDDDDDDCDDYNDSDYHAILESLGLHF